ncbi:hypothetical protein D9M69_732860 [compost metagenome]
MSFSRCGVSPRPTTLDTTLAPTRFMKPRPLLPMATTSMPSPAACKALNSLVAARNTLVLRPPQRPLSVVTTTKPAVLPSLASMKGCVYSGFALLRLPAI